MNADTTAELAHLRAALAAAQASAGEWANAAIVEAARCTRMETEIARLRAAIAEALRRGAAGCGDWREPLSEV